MSVTALEVTPEPRSARREAQRLATRERLLEVSVAQFRHSGFARTDIAAIVQQAGVSRGTFYFHFPTKEDVLVELRLREERRIAEELAASAKRGRSIKALLRAVVEGVVTAEQRLGADLVREMCAVQFRPGVIDTDSPADHPIAELVLTAITSTSADKTSRRDPLDMTVVFLTGLFGLLATQTGPSEERTRLIDLLIELTAKGVSEQ